MRATKLFYSLNLYSNTRRERSRAEHVRSTQSELYEKGEFIFIYIISSLIARLVDLLEKGEKAWEKSIKRGGGERWRGLAAAPRKL